MPADTPAAPGRSGQPLGLRGKLWLGLVAASVVAVLLAGLLGRRSVIRRHIDAGWFRESLVRDNLAHWLAATPTESGFFRSIVDRQWRPAEKQVGTLVSQCRLIYVMVSGYEVTGDEAYRAAARQGADFLLRHFRDREHGGWFWSVTPNGEPLSTRKGTYGHAFVIFGLAHAYRVTGDTRYRAAALETVRAIKDHLVDEHGGITPGARRDWTRRRGGNSVNPIMHLFEALLALHDATQSEAVFQEARRLADFVFTRLYRPEPGYLPENYDADWKPLPDDKHGYVDLGHQFEWAFLLSRAAEKGWPRRFLTIGHRLLDFGMASGFDRENGGVFSSSTYDGRLKGKRKSWWQQTEHLRALMRYAADHGREDLWPAFDKSLAFVKAEFIDHKYGGWYTYAQPKEPETDTRPRKGGVWKVGYHTAGMYLEALRLAGALRRPAAGRAGPD